MVPSKGVEEPWVARRSAAWMNSLGYNKLVLRVDGEASIKALAREVKRVRGDTAETLVEHPERGESQSNGAIESAVGVAEGLVNLPWKIALVRNLDQLKT